MAVVAISIVVELGVSGLIPDFGPMPPGPVAFPTAYATAEARMQERPGGPWVFTGATAFDLVSGGPYSPSDLFPHYLSCGYDIALVAAPGVEIPAFDGSVPSDLAPWWVFSYASEAGDVTVFAVTDARAIPLAEIVSGPPCGPLVLAHYPALPAGIIADSPSMIANLSPPGGALPCPTCFGGAPPGGTSAEFNSTLQWYDGIFRHPYGGTWSFASTTCSPLTPPLPTPGAAVPGCGGWAESANATTGASTSLG